MSEPEHAHRNALQPPLPKTITHQGSTVPESLKTLEAALILDHKGLSSIPNIRTTPEPESISQFLNHLRLRAELRKIV